QAGACGDRHAVRARLRPDDRLTRHIARLPGGPRCVREVQTRSGKSPQRRRDHQGRLEETGGQGMVWRVYRQRYAPAGVHRTECIFVEENEPAGPYGAKGVGEIGLVPTAPAVAGALFAFDGIRRTKLPMKDSPAACAILGKK